MKKKFRIGIILPCHNEQNSINLLVEQIKELNLLLGSNFEAVLYFIDDGSKDNTWDILERSVSDSNSKVIQIHAYKLKENLGKSLAQSIGLKIALDSCDFFVLMDSDGQHNFLDIPNQVKKLSESTPIRIGYRVNYRRNPFNQVSTFFLSKILASIGSHYQESASEFILLNKLSLLRLIETNELGVLPILDVIYNSKIQYTYFDTKISPRIDGSSSTRFSKPDLWAKALTHIISNPFSLLSKITNLIFLSTILVGIYALFVGISSLGQERRSGIGSILLVQVMSFVVTNSLIVILIALVVNLAKRAEIDKTKLIQANENIVSKGISNLQ